MSIKFGCPHCQKSLVVKDELGGKRAKCPGCQQVLDIPVASVAEPPPANPPARPGAAPSARPGAAPPARPANAPAGGTAPPVRPAAPGARSGAASPPAKPGAPGAAPPARPANAPAGAVRPARPAPVAQGVAAPPGDKSAATRPAAKNQAIRAKQPDGKPPAVADEVAARLLTDEPKPAKPKQSTIEFNCFYCDEVVSVELELGGKQAPCPHCKRIIKVPKPVSDEPKDWRTVESKPALAKTDTDPAPDGAWGSAVTSSTVTRGSLEEAGIIAQPEEELTLREKLTRYALYAAPVLAIAAIYFIWSNIAARNKQERALEMALAAVDEKADPPLAPLDAAEVHRGAGVFYMRLEDAQQAREQFSAARGVLRGSKPSFEQDYLHRDLAVNMVGLGGEGIEVTEGQRLKWDDTQDEMRRALEAIQNADLRAEAVRTLAGKLGARGQQARAAALARLVSGAASAEVLAQVALEVNDENINKLAQQAYEQTLAALDKDAPRPLPPPALIALLMKLEQMETLQKLVKFPVPGAPWPLQLRHGYAMGLAYQGKWGEALEFAEVPGDPAANWRVLVSLARIAENQPERAKPILDAAIEGTTLALQRRAALSPVLLIELIRSAARAGQVDRCKELLEALPANLQGRGRYELLSAALAKADAPALDALREEVERKASAAPQVIELIARHAAALGKGSVIIDEAASWEPGPLAPAAYVGIALGLQDARLGSKD